MNGAELIAAERKRQIEQEGWTVEHDDQHRGGEMALAGASYALVSKLSGDKRAYCRDMPNIFPWPWDKKWWKPSTGDSSQDRIRELVKAGALIAAEIDRLQRLEVKGE